MKWIEWTSERVVLGTFGCSCISMATVLAHMYSDEGFAIAADGVNVTRDGAKREITSRKIQKIFPLPGVGRAVACTFFGRVSLYDDACDQVVFKFISECINAADAISSIPVLDIYEFIGKLAPLVVRNSPRSNRMVKSPAIQIQSRKSRVKGGAISFKFLWTDISAGSHSEAELGSTTITRLWDGLTSWTQPSAQWLPNLRLAQSQRKAF